MEVIEPDVISTALKTTAPRKVWEFTKQPTNCHEHTPIDDIAYISYTTGNHFWLKLVLCKQGLASPECSYHVVLSLSREAAEVFDVLDSY